MAFILYRSRGAGNPITYSADDPTSAQDNTPFVLQTTDGNLFVRQEDGSYLPIDVSDIEVINARSGLPAPTADADGKLAVSNDGVYFVDIFQTAATPASATFSDYTATGYRGSQNTLPQRPQTGETFYHTSEHQWYHVATSNGDNYWVSGGTPTGWIPGNYTSEPDALQGINRLIASGTTTGVVWTGTSPVQRFSAFVPAVDPETHRRWDRIASGTGGTSGLTEAQVKAEIRILGQTDSTDAAAREDLVSLMDGAASDDERISIDDTKGEIPDGRIPATVTRDIEILDAALDANTNIRFPDSKLPIGVLYRDTAVANFPSGLARDDEIATEARSGNTARWAVAKLPIGVLYRDTDVANFPSGLARDDEVEDAATVGNTARWTVAKLPTDVLYRGTDVANFPSGLARVSALAAYALSSAVPTNAEIRTIVGNMVDGGTETGITVTFNPTTGKLNFVVSGGTTPPPAISTHQRYAAFGADTTFVATDFTGAGGVGATTNTLTISGATGSQYVAFWSAEALTRIDATGRAAFGSTNQFDRFNASRLTISSTNGYLYVSDAAFVAGYINGLWTLE